MLDTISDSTTLTGAQRAAVLIVTLGVETASVLLPALSDNEVERVTVEVARLESVPRETVEQVLADFYEAVSNSGAASTASGGLEAARGLLRNSLGGERAEAILPRVEAATEGTGFDLVRRAVPERVAAFLEGEHAQTAAIVLSHLEARPAADTLALLEPETRSDVIRRLSSLNLPSAQILKDLDAALRATFGVQPMETPGGTRLAADILTQTSRDTGRAVLDSLQARDPALAAEIESMLFSFEDLQKLSARALGRVLSSIDQSILARALRGTPEGFQSLVFDAVSERVGAAVKEEMELSAPLKVSDVEDAQRQIVEATLALADQNEIEIGAPAETAEAEVI